MYESETYLSTILQMLFSNYDECKFEKLTKYSGIPRAISLEYDYPTLVNVGCKIEEASSSLHEILSERSLSNFGKCKMKNVCCHQCIPQDISWKCVSQATAYVKYKIETAFFLLYDIVAKLIFQM